MPRLQLLPLLALLAAGLSAQSLPEDPVLKARAQRAQSQGVKEGDLPPVPRTVQEPPPLPAPEAHPKEGRKGKVAARLAKATKGKAVKGKAGKQTSPKAGAKTGTKKRSKKR